MRATQILSTIFTLYKQILKKFQIWLFFSLVYEKKYTKANVRTNTLYKKQAMTALQGMANVKVHQ